MRFPGTLITRLLPALVIALLSSALPANAEILFARTRLSPVITEIMSSATDDWTTYTSCTVAHGGDTEQWRNRWNLERTIVIATLWANDFPESVIRQIEDDTLIPDPLPPAPSYEECQTVRDRVEQLPSAPRIAPHDRVWTKMAEAGIDWPAPVRPMSAEGLARVEAAYAEVLPQQARALRCHGFWLTTIDEKTRKQDLVEKFWTEEIARVRKILHDAGWPHDVIDRVMLPTAPASLAARPEIAAITEADCKTDETWMKWLYDNTFSTKAVSEVEKVIAESFAPETLGP